MRLKIHKLMHSDGERISFEEDSDEMTGGSKIFQLKSPGLALKKGRNDK